MLIDKKTNFRIIADAMKEFGKTIIGNRVQSSHWIDKEL
jgi:hypothetical protein